MRQDRTERNARHAHIEDHDEQKIQKNVRGARDHQIDHRTAGVPP